MKKTKHKEKYLMLISWLAKNANWGPGQYKNGILLKKGEIWATRNYIANILGYSKYFIGRALKKLEEANWITITHNNTEKVIISLNWITNQIFQVQHLNETKCNTSSNFVQHLNDGKNQEIQSIAKQNKTDTATPSPRKCNTSFKESATKKYNKNIEIIKEEEYINREFQKFWNFYLSWSKNNPNLAVSDISVKKAKNNYHALIEEEILTPEEILQLTEKYLLKCQVLQSKAKSPANFLDELFEQEARDMLRNYDIVDSLTLKNENLHIYFDFNKKDRFIFKYKDSALNTDQVLKILKRELPGKSDNEIIELINSFRAYLNKFKHSGLVDVKQYFFDFLREEVE